MSVDKRYEYVGEGIPSSVPRRMTEEEIEHVISRTLSIFEGKKDSVVKQQGIEFANVLRRDLRRELILDASWLDGIVEYLKSRLLDSVVMIHDRIGTKAAGSIVSDLQQQVISEKRGGSGKESGLSSIKQFDELVSVTENRKSYYVWVYPKDLHSDREREMLKRDLVGVKLADILSSARLASYDTESKQPPAWYQDVEQDPVMGFHYELELEIVKMYAKGVLMSHVRDAIASVYPPEMRKTITIVTSPYTEGRVDIFFEKMENSGKEVSILGSKVYNRKDSLLIKGIEGVEWISESRVEPSGCLLESIQLEDGRWSTYYSLVPAMKLGLGERDLLKWMTRSGLQFEHNSEQLTFYTPYDPRPTLSKYTESGLGVEVRLEIEYTGKNTGQFFVDERFDTSRTITNDPHANQFYLGVSIARWQHISELFDLAKKSTSNLDSRHVELVGDTMASTGVLTGITAKGAELRGADLISRILHKKAEKTISLAATFGEETLNNTLSSTRFTGNQAVPLGSVVQFASSRPLAGVVGSSASEQYVTSLRGHRIPAFNASTSLKVIEEAKNAEQEQGAVIPKSAIKRSKINRRALENIARKRE